MRKPFDGAEQVRALRKQGKTLTEIIKETGVSRSTAFLWIRDMPVPEIDGVDIRTLARKKNYWRIAKRAEGNRVTCADKRDKASVIGMEEAKELLQERDVRDFVCLYLAEGTKKGLHCVSVINTDASIVVLSARMLLRFSSRPVAYRLFCSEDEKDKLTKFWAETLGVSEQQIRFQNKKKINGKRSEYGLLSVVTSDTYFKCRLMSWIGELKKDWAVSSIG